MSRNLARKRMDKASTGTRKSAREGSQVLRTTFLRDFRDLSQYSQQVLVFPPRQEAATVDALSGSSGGSVQALKKVDMLAQSNVASGTPFRLERQHVHQLVVPCVRDSGIHLHSDSLRWRNHPLCHRPGEKTVVLLGLRLVGSTPTWSNRENVSNPPHRTQTRGHSLRGS